MGLFVCVEEGIDIFVYLVYNKPKDIHKPKKYKMKKIIRFLSVVAIVIIAFSSCSKDVSRDLQKVDTGKVRDTLWVARNVQFTEEGDIDEKIKKLPRVVCASFYYIPATNPTISLPKFGYKITYTSPQVGGQVEIEYSMNAGTGPVLTTGLFALEPTPGSSTLDFQGAEPFEAIAGPVKIIRVITSIEGSSRVRYYYPRRNVIIG